MTATTVAWLHNMSSAPNTVIRHQGAVAEGTRQVVFEVTRLGVIASAGYPALTALFAEKPQKRSLRLEKEARGILQQHAKTLPYPAAALVIVDRIAADAADETDFLTICTVLSKSNDRLYLRDKEPNLSRIRLGRRIALLLPSKQAERPQ
jgi:hypothetical protein